MRNVLIPTDFSDNSLNACDYALQFFKDQTCNIHLLHIVKPENGADQETQWNASPTVVENVNLKPSIKKLQEIAEIMRVKHQNENYRFFTVAQYGYFVDEVRNQLSEKNIDFIVMGTTGTSEGKKTLIGSNAADIITKVKCTTLVIPEKARFNTPKVIVFPSDFTTTYSVQNLEPLLEILDRYNATLNALYVNGERNQPLVTQKETNRDYFIDCFHNKKLSFVYLTNGNLDEGIDSFIKSSDIDMIAMMGKKLNFFHQLLFKPNIEEVTFQTNVPFLILHE